MLDYLKYRHALAKLQKERRAVVASMPQPVINEEFEFPEDQHQKLEVAEHKIYRLTLDYYWEMAFKFGVAVPSGSDYWENSQAFPGTDHLNRKGLSLLKSAIHEERKKQSEFFAIWVAGLTGLVGAITGLVSVITAMG